MAKFNLMKKFSLFFEDTALINVKRFLLRPIEHYRQLREHDKESKKKKKVSNIQPLHHFLKNVSLQVSQWQKDDLENCHFTTKETNIWQY